MLCRTARRPNTRAAAHRGLARRRLSAPASFLIAPFRDQDFIRSPDNFEGAPKPDAFETVEPAFDREFVAELRRAPIIDLGPNDHRIFLCFRHRAESEPELLGQQGASDFDETEVSDVVDDRGAVCVEKHYLHFGANPGRIFFQHEVQFSETAELPATAGVCHRSSWVETAAATSSTLTAFMQRKSIGPSP